MILQASLSGEQVALLSLRTASVLVGAWIAFKIALAAYNISPFHPLYKYPGPKAAAFSYLYEGYYDLILVGRYTRRIQQMHERYGTLPMTRCCGLAGIQLMRSALGPIIRANPDELHCSDPYFLDEIYAGGNRKRDKWQRFLNTGATVPSKRNAFSIQFPAPLVYKYATYT